MAFRTTQWQFSDEEERESEYRYPAEGDAWLYIEDARFDEDQQRYHIWFKDLREGGVPFSIAYNLSKVDPATSTLVPNTVSRNTLISLNKALFAAERGIPNPVDIIGGVVGGTIKLRDYNGRKYVNIYRYFPPDENMVVFADIEQYYTGYVADDGSGAE